MHYPVHPPEEGSTPFGLGLSQASGPFGHLRDRALLALQRRMLRFGLAPVNAARRELGMPPLDEVFEQFHRLDRSLILTSREFDFVPLNLLEHVRYVGPQLDDPAWPEPWSSPWPDEAPEPLVLVSLGSTYQRQDQSFNAIVEALGALEVRALATYGPVARPRTPPPPNVHVAASAPHAAVLPVADAVVCHGGHGTVMKALAHGVPVVFMPFGRDQKNNGARVVAARAGVSISSRARPRRIADAVGEVLQDTRIHEGARRMADIIARDLASDLAVAELESLAGEPVARASS